jgi:polar amino acid transport system substrate-binding protein
MKTKYFLIFLLSLICINLYCNTILENPAEKPINDTSKVLQHVQFTNAEKRWINDNPVIIFGFDPEFAPFEFSTEKYDFIGIAADYLEIIEKQTGIKFQYSKDLPWNDVLKKIKINEIDMLSCVGITDERKEFLNFSKPYAKFHRVIITRDDFPFISGMSELKNTRIAVQESSSHDGFIRENTKLKPINYKTLREALLAVSNGEAEALIANVASATYNIRKLHLTNLKVAAPVSQSTKELHFAVRKEYPELIGIINKVLDNINVETQNAISQKWINIDYKPGISTKQLLIYILEVIAILLIPVIIFVIWNYKLKSEIKKRNKIEEELYRANEELKNLDKLKSMFIASMSHELRTPLNSIIGFTGIILKGMVGELNEKQKDHLSRVYSSSKHLLALITDVIDISKIEAGRIDTYPEEFSLQSLINECILTIEPQLKKKDLQLVIESDSTIQMFSEKRRLKQAIINFLSNAVKYSDKGIVTIKTHLDNDSVVIAVSDTGIGISTEGKEKLFEAFERLDSHLRIKAGGTGLGLYLTKKLVTELLKGEIYVESELNVGSSFTIKVPKTLSIDDNEGEVA